MSSIDDISKAVDIFRSLDCSFELMHCISTYPMKEENANLNSIYTLREQFDCNVGYSGHESGLAISYAAASMGISSLERHITLDRSMYGSDQSASLEKPGLERLVRDIYRTDLILGDGIKRIWDSEKPVMKKLRNQ